MNQHQLIALQQSCKFAFETVQEKFSYLLGNFSLVLTVNSGYE